CLIFPFPPLVTARRTCHAGGPQTRETRTEEASRPGTDLFNVLNNIPEPARPKGSSPPMQRMTTAQATVETLIRHGINTVYGVPGVHNDPLFDALHGAGDRIRVLHARHEQTAGYMALGAALATGRPQAFAVVPGPGLLNASAALLTAWGMDAPVLALVGQIPQNAIDRGHGHLHEIPDQLGLLRHLTKFAARIRGPQEAPGLVAEALRQAMTGRRRPVALECAIDVWGRAAPVEPADPLPAERPAVDPEAITEAV